MLVTREAGSQATGRSAARPFGAEPAARLDVGDGSDGLLGDERFALLGGQSAPDAVWLAGGQRPAQAALHHSAAPADGLGLHLALGARRSSLVLRMIEVRCVKTSACCDALPVPVSLAWNRESPNLGQRSALRHGVARPEERDLCGVQRATARKVTRCRTNSFFNPGQYGTDGARSTGFGVCSVL
jgi:hypothetical protein